MRNKIKSKVFWDIWPTDEVYKYDPITWEYTRLIVERKIINNRFKPNKIFMKTFLWWNQIKIYSVAWEDCKYFWVLWDCMWYDNELNIQKFKSIIWITESNFSKLKKRLYDNWVIAEINKQYFMNPIIAIKSDTIQSELWNLFEEKNHILYWIDNL